jgi:hypothetical protein
VTNSSVPGTSRDGGMRVLHSCIYDKDRYGLSLNVWEYYVCEFVERWSSESGMHFQVPWDF